MKKRLSDVIGPTDAEIREIAAPKRSLALELFKLWLLPIATIQLWK
jgi:hypothetical protein